MLPGTTFNTLPWYRSLRFKLVLTAVVVEIFMLGLLLSNSYRLLGEALETQTLGRLDALKPLLNAALASRVFQRDHSEIQAIIDQLVSREQSEIRYMVVTDPRGQPIAHAGTISPAEALRIKQDIDPLQCLDDQTFDTQTPLTLSGTLEVGTVRFGLSLLSLTGLRDRMLQQSLVIAAGEVLVSLLLLASLGYLLTRHLSTLLAATRRVASADFSQPIRIDSRDEVGLLADDFNTMQQEVQQRIVALADSEGRFRTIFDAAGDAFFIHDGVTGELLDVNRRMCEMYRCTRAEALQADLMTDFSSGSPPYDGEHALEKLRLARETGMQTFDWQARRRSGEVFWVEVNLRHVRIGSQERIIALVRDISERMQHQQKLEFLAHHDPLTQLPNRLLFSDRLQQATAQTRRKQRLLAIVMLDLDGFKPVNDTLGHEVGDRLLIQVAQRLRDSMREGDTVARLGGDEFALLIGDLETVEEGAQTIQRVLAAISRTFSIDSYTLNISASLGVTLYPFDDADSDTLIRHADQAMYVAKQHGRNRFHLFDAEHDRLAQAHHDARSRIAEALQRQEFVLHYQPQVDMRTRRVTGMEALIRWQHPQEGLLPPGRFLPVVEDSELAIPLGEWVLDEVMVQMARWQAQGLALKVSANISARHLQDPAFFKSLTERLGRYPDISPRQLGLEVVESVALADIAKVSEIIDDCHALGIRFALDDFGTGYSSLSYFKRLKIDQVKIDKSFVIDMLTDEEDHAIVAGVIALSRTFRRDTIAEGVESHPIALALSRLGCHQLQGYGIARPMAAEAVSAWVRQWQAEPHIAPAPHSPATAGTPGQG